MLICEFKDLVKTERIPIFLDFFSIIHRGIRPWVKRPKKQPRKNSGMPRKRDRLPSAQDLPSAFTFIVSVYAAILLSQFLYNQLGDFTVSTFNMISRTNLDIAIPQLYYQAAIVIFTASIPIMATVCVVGVIVSFLTVGPVFALEVFKFDLKNSILFRT